MPGVDEVHPSGGGVDVEDVGGDELVAAELIVDDKVRLARLLQDVPVPATGVTQCSHSQTGEQGGAEPGAHAVGGGDVEVVGRHGGVGAGTGDGIRRLESNLHRDGGGRGG